MKMVEFFDNEDGTYDVRTISLDPESKDDWAQYGVLKFDKDQNAWVLWTGTSYSEGKMAKQSDEGVTYEESLKDTEQEIKDELI